MKQIKMKHGHISLNRFSEWLNYSKNRKNMKRLPPNINALQWNFLIINWQTSPCLMPDLTTKKQRNGLKPYLCSRNLLTCLKNQNLSQMHNSGQPVVTKIKLNGTRLPRPIFKLQHDIPILISRRYHYTMLLSVLKTVKDSQKQQLLWKDLHRYTRIPMKQLMRFSKPEKFTAR